MENLVQADLLGRIISIASDGKSSIGWFVRKDSFFTASDGQSSLEMIPGLLLKNTENMFS